MEKSKKCLAYVYLLLQVDLLLLATHISRRHCEFRRREEKNGRSYWNICDLGSTCKTFVNGHFIAAHEEIGELC